MIQDCRIGYRTFGALNADKSNAILFPMWFAGRSSDTAVYVGPEKLLDPSRYFIIAVDPLGNGVSSSPSNSAAQPGGKFPAFTISDMVEQEYRLLTEALHLTHLRGVIGISMGGMQALEWAVAHPEFSGRVVSIVGSPRLSGYDQILWRTMKAALQSDAAQREGKPNSEGSGPITAGIMVLALQTPEMISRTVPPEKAGDVIEQWEKLLASMDATDWIYQTDAMLAHDILPRFEALPPVAAEHVRSSTLIIVAALDHAVDPRPAVAFANSLQHPAVVLDSPCGHVLTYCEAETEIVNGVRVFVEQAADRGRPNSSTGN